MGFKNKRIISIIVGLFLLVAIPLSMPIGAWADRHAERDIKIWINDFYIMSDVHPFVENDRTYVPIRFIAEELGYDVGWDGSTRTVTISDDKTEVLLTIDSNKVIVNGETNSLDAPARLRDERTFIPLRAIAELFGEEVQYDSITKVALIGDGFNPDEYYPIRYYYRDKAPFISNSKINFITFKVKYSDGEIAELSTDEQILMLIDAEAAKYQPLNFQSQVEIDKQLFDRYYIAPLETDPFIGSWYGKTKTKGTTEYYDQYVYIEKVADNKYLSKKRSLKPNGSELMTESYATYDAETGIMHKEQSHKTSKATGDFGYNWYATSGKYKVENFDYMYGVSDSNLFLRKY